MKHLSLCIFVLLLIPGLHAFGQVKISADDDPTPPHPSAILDITADSLGVVIPRMTKAQRDAILSPTNGLMVYVTTHPKGFYFYNGSEWTTVAGSGKHYVGELYGGGVVGYVNHTGQHGLIFTVNELDTAHIWSNVTTIAVGDSARSSWNGFQNSTFTVNQPQHTHSAAQLCLNYTNPNYGTGQFSNWVLPAIDQLRLLFDNRYEVNKALELDGNPASTFIFGTYYSSTEATDSTAWASGFSHSDFSNLTGADTGFYDISSVTSMEDGFEIMKSDSLYVRCVREF